MLRCTHKRMQNQIPHRPIRYLNNILIIRSVITLYFTTVRNASELFLLYILWFINNSDVFASCILNPRFLYHQNRKRNSPWETNSAYISLISYLSLQKQALRVQTDLQFIQIITETKRNSGFLSHTWPEWWSVYLITQRNCDFKWT